MVSGFRIFSKVYHDDVVRGSSPFTTNMTDHDPFVGWVVGWFGVVLRTIAPVGTCDQGRLQILSIFLVYVCAVFFSYLLFTSHTISVVSFRRSGKKNVDRTGYNGGEQISVQITVRFFALLTYCILDCVFSVYTV